MFENIFKVGNFSLNIITQFLSKRKLTNLEMMSLQVDSKQKKTVLWWTHYREAYAAQLEVNNTIWLFLMVCLDTGFGFADECSG